MRSVWNPRLLDEPEDEYLDTASLFKNASPEFESGYERGLAKLEEQAAAEMEMTGGMTGGAFGSTGQGFGSPMGEFDYLDVSRFKRKV